MPRLRAGHFDQRRVVNRRYGRTGLSRPRDLGRKAMLQLLVHVQRLNQFRLSREQFPNRFNAEDHLAPFAIVIRLRWYKAAEETRAGPEADVLSSDATVSKLPIGRILIYIAHRRGLD